MPDPINDPIESPSDPQAQTNKEAQSDLNLSFKSDSRENAPLIEKKASQRIAGFFRNLGSSFQKNRTPASSGEDAPEEVSNPGNSSADQPEIDMEMLTFDRLENLGLEFAETSSPPAADPEVQNEAFSVLPDDDPAAELPAAPESVEPTSPPAEETPETAPETDVPLEEASSAAFDEDFDAAQDKDEDEDPLSSLRMFFDSAEDDSSSSQFSYNPPAYEHEVSDIDEEPKEDFETFTLKPSSSSASFTQDDLQAFLKSLDSKDDEDEAADFSSEDSEADAPEDEGYDEDPFSQLRGWFSGEEKYAQEKTETPELNTFFTNSEKEDAEKESPDDIRISDYFPQNFNIDSQVFSLDKEEIPTEPEIAAQTSQKQEWTPDNPLPVQENEVELFPYTSPFLDDDEPDPTLPAKPRPPRLSVPENEDADSALTNLRAAFTSDGDEAVKEKKEVQATQNSPQITAEPENRNLALNLKKILQQEEKVSGPDETAPLLKPKVKTNQEPEPFILDVIFIKIQKYLSVKSNRRQLAIFSIPILAVILITAAVLFFNGRNQIQLTSAALQLGKEDAKSAITPSSLKLPGGWIFYLQSNHMENGEWKPITAEWMEGATVRRVIALPWNRQSEAVIRSLVKGDEIDLFMSNNDVKGYQVEEVKQVSREDTSILTSNKPSLVIILYREDDAQRWVVICRQ